MEELEPVLTEDFVDYLKELAIGRLVVAKGFMYSIAQLRSHLDAIDEAFDGMSGVDYARDKVSVSATDNGMVNLVTRKQDYKAACEAELAGYIDESERVRAELENVRQPWRCILAMRYLDNRRWSEIAKLTSFSESHCKGKLHQEALFEYGMFLYGRMNHEAIR